MLWIANIDDLSASVFLALDVTGDFYNSFL
jgi:hypothetical protein